MMDQLSSLLHRLLPTMLSQWVLNAKSLWCQEAPLAFCYNQIAQTKERKLIILGLYARHEAYSMSFQLGELNDPIPLQENQDLKMQVQL